MAYDKELDEILENYKDGVVQIVHASTPGLTMNDVEEKAKTKLNDLLRRVEVEVKTELYTGWLTWVTSGGGHISRKQLEEELAELKATPPQPNKKED